MRAPTSATMGERTAATRALYATTSGGSIWSLPNIDGPRPGRCRSGSNGPSVPVRLGRPLEGAWREPLLLAVAAAVLWRAGVRGAAADRCGERDRERAKESDDLDQATDRHWWVPPDPTGDFDLGPCSRTVRGRRREV